MGNPWKTLSKANTKVNDANVDDTVNLFFNRGDTWTMNTAAVSKTYVYGFKVDSDDPVVNIDAYGFGNKPIFDGLVSDFSSVPSHNQATGPLLWNCIFQFDRHDCSASNIEIKRVYGIGIHIKDGNGFTLSDSDIHDFGSSGFGSNANFAATDLTAQRCIFHTGQELFRYSKRSGWEAAIQFESNRYKPSGCIVRHCLVYDIYGEGINAPNGIIEYNVVGNTGSMAIGISPHKWDAETTIVRYNFITMADWSTHSYDSLPGGDDSGIRVFDEDVGGTNANADISIYGNIVINRIYGFRMYATNEGEGAFGLVKVYNNTFIDSHNANIRVADYIGGTPSISTMCTDFRFYNNASILYDQTGASYISDNIGSGGFGAATIDNNAYWTTGGNPTVDSNWRTNYITTDPKLPGEPSIDWDGQSGPTYFSDIDFDTHLYQPIDSALVNAGKTLDAGFDNKLLTKGTKWSDSPGITAQLAEQSVGDWDIGASKYSEMPNADINNDGKVSLEDFAVLAVWWEDENACSSPNWCEGADFNMSGTVDMLDLTYFAENWLRQAW